MVHGQHATELDDFPDSLVQANECRQKSLKIVNFEQGRAERREESYKN